MSVVFEHRLRIAGTETRVLELDGDGPPLILLHGWADSADTWRPVLDRLRKLHRRAIAIDMPGYGTATHLERDEPILVQHDRFIRAARVRFAQDEPAILVGNSLGGCAAIRAAQDPRLPLMGVIPIAPAGLDMAGWFQVVETERLIGLLLASPVPVPPNVVRRTVAQVYRRVAFARPSEINDRVIASFSSHISTRRQVVRILATGKRLRTELLDPFELGKVECPVMVVWGSQDRMLFPSGADRLLAEVSNIRLELIERCGHCPQVEDPDRVTTLIDEFASVAATRTPL